MCIRDRDYSRIGCRVSSDHIAYHCAHTSYLLRTHGASGGGQSRSLVLDQRCRAYLMVGHSRSKDVYKRQGKYSQLYTDGTYVEVVAPSSS